MFKRAVISLSLLMLMTSAAAGNLPAIRINGRAVPDETINLKEGQWHFEYKREFSGAKMPGWAAEELQLDPSGWRCHPEQPHISGYNGDITVKLEIPGNLEAVSVTAQYVNFSDARTRTAEISYSFNGSDYLPITRESGAGGATDLAGAVSFLGTDRKVLWLRFSRDLERGDATGMRRYVVFKSLGISANGSTAAPEKPVFATINSFPVEDFPLTRTDAGWSFAYARNFVDDGAAERCRELLLDAHRWRQHAKHAYIRGYNGDITLKITTPGSIVELDANAKMINYRDRRTRRIMISYSFNGTDFHRVAEEEFDGGEVNVGGSLKLPEHAGLLWLRFGRILDDDDRGGRAGNVVFRNISFTLKGDHALKSTEVKSSAKTIELKSFLPTGVYWSWERTKPNADLAGMDIWEFVEAAMKLLSESNCNLVWIVNIMPGDDTRRILDLAEKYRLKVLLGTHLHRYFRGGFGSFRAMRDAARKTVNDIGDRPALLAYVLKDEPLLCSLGHHNYFFDLLKRFDPTRDSIVVSMKRQAPSYLAETVLPVVSPDFYPFGHDKSINIPNPAAESQRSFRNTVSGYGKIAENYGKHYWMMPQMFGSVWGRHFRRGDKIVVEPGSYLHWRMPTDAETRWQVWESLRCGSKGVVFYTLLPPVPFFDNIPEQVEPGSIEERMLQRMDRLAETAASWGRQELTKGITEIDPGEGILQPGGKPTPQMAAMVEAFGHLRRNADLINSWQFADFPVFFASDEDTQVATFAVADQKQLRYGLVVNDDLENDRKIKLLLPVNVVSVKNLNTGEALSVKGESAAFRSCEIELATGDGCVIEARFLDSEPGMPMLHERFTQALLKVKLNPKAEIKRFGEFRVEPFHGVSMMDGFAEPVFTIENLVNHNTANNTVLMNVNLRQEHGVVYCMTKGRLEGVEIVAVTDAESLARETNVAHLADDLVEITSDQSTAERRVVIQSENFNIPTIVPPGATSLEFFVKDGAARIDDVNIWFVEHARQ